MARLSDRPLKIITFFVVLISSRYINTYEISILLKLEDKGLSDCIPVVVTESRKWGRIWGLLFFCSVLKKQFNNLSLDEYLHPMRFY